jgi:hypothetical protein
MALTRRILPKEIREKFPATGFYVYHLVDSRDGSVFYVGKGTGDRVMHHEREAAKASYMISPKIERIQSIWDEGGTVVRVMVRSFESEHAAYQFEKNEIWRIGHENLTNLLFGQESEHTHAKRAAERFIRDYTAFAVARPDRANPAMALVAEMKENLAAINRYLGVAA